MVGAAIAGSVASSIGGSLISSSAAQSAASQQANAEEQSAQLQAQQQAQTQANLAPYNHAGQSNLPAYTNFYQGTQTALNAASAAQQAQIPNGASIAAAVQSSPAYQFNLQQGLAATQANAASAGLGVSGASLKGAANYATGLANTYYQNAFNNAQTIYGDYGQQYSNALNTANTTFGQLSAPIAVGENAAAQTGVTGQLAAANTGNAIASAGQATAAGTVGSATALNNGLATAGNSGLNALAYSSLYGSSQNAAGSIPAGGSGTVPDGEGGGQLYGNST